MAKHMFEIAKAKAVLGEQDIRLYFKLDEPTLPKPDFPFLITVTSMCYEAHYGDYSDIVSAAKAFDRLTTAQA